MCKRSIIHTAAALAASALLFASEAGAEPVNIECDDSEKYLVVGLTNEEIRKNTIAPKNLRDYACWLAVNAPAILGYDPETGKDTTFAIEDVIIDTSNVYISNEGVENAAIIHTSADGELGPSGGGFITVFSTAPAPQCNNEILEYIVGNYEQRWCDSEESNGNKRATMNLYYRFPGNVRYLTSYYYHCYHPQDVLKMPTEVVAEVCT